MGGGGGIPPIPGGGGGGGGIPPIPGGGGGGGMTIFFAMLATLLLVLSGFAPSSCNRISA